MAGLAYEISKRCLQVIAGVVKNIMSFLMQFMVVSRTCDYVRNMSAAGQVRAIEPFVSVGQE